MEYYRMTPEQQLDFRLQWARTRNVAIDKPWLHLQWERNSYTDDTTTGKLHTIEANYVRVDKLMKKYFSYTLEDTARPPNIKVTEHTAIPADLMYFVGKHETLHYGRTIIFYTELDKVTIRCGPLTWTYCLAHGGNDIADTVGCLLVAKNLIDKEHIQGSMKVELAKLVWDFIDAGGFVTAMAVNLPQLK